MPSVLRLGLIATFAAIGFRVGVARADQSTVRNRPVSEAAAAEQFEKQVRPVLVERCQRCHSGKDPKGGLRLDSAKGLRHGGDSGAVFDPAKPEESLLIQAVRQRGDLKMPPPPGQKLTDPQIAGLVTWIKNGAIWPESGSVSSPGNKSDTAAADSSASVAIVFTPEEKNFWAYQPVKDFTPPDVKDKTSCKTAIDRFLRSKQEAAGLVPAPQSDKRTLIRRVTFDLTGLPPTPDEIDAFLKDDSPRAFESVVNRLLDSPSLWRALGPALARRCAIRRDDRERRQRVMRYAWRYRNYVIDAFNRDLPYDQFVIEQLAGDLLPRRPTRPRASAALSPPAT